MMQTAFSFQTSLLDVKVPPPIELRRALPDPHQLDRYSLDGLPDIRGHWVYFLFFKNRLVYIGSTYRPSVRPTEHKKKRFDSVAYLPGFPDYETKFIRAYAPHYNTYCCK